MKPALKPCPFCGSAAAYIETASFTGMQQLQAWFAQCTNHAVMNKVDPCGAWQSGRTPEEAAERWNRRASEIEPRVLIVHQPATVSTGPSAKPEQLN